MKVDVRHGFTLVEIMIVISILAALAAIALPSFLSYRKTSHDTACLDNQTIIRDACTLHMIRTGEKITDLDELCEASGGVAGFRHKPKCPISGNYTISYDEQSGFSVSCDKAAEHGQLD